MFDQTLTSTKMEVQQSDFCIETIPDKDINTKLLSDITVFMKYSRYLPSFERRETWEEIVLRNAKMHIKKFPKLEDEIWKVYSYVFDKAVLPSMRSMQFAGPAMEISNARMYNCSYRPANSIDFFSETMFLLLTGCGVGYSVQKQHVNELPKIKKPKKTRRFLIGDSIAGWADAVKVLMRAYLDPKKETRPIFDFRDIRHKGALLVTSGGRAPGPEPLKICLTKIEAILEVKEENDKLTPLEVHDIACHIADAVLAGGIRRAAMISFFSEEDHEMMACKTGNWYELNPQRGRANNSVVFDRKTLTRETFDIFWNYLKNSGSGEPGFILTNDLDMLSNPCGEVALQPFQMCNLTTINGNKIKSQKEFETYVKAATFIGTLQASYTDFYYLNDEWKNVTEQEALLGVSITGWASGVHNFDLSSAAKVALEENERVSKIIGINKAARVTLTKPEGTSSLILGTSSGIHPWHNDYYIRRIRVNKNESIYQYLKEKHPEIIEDEYFSPDTTAVISIPIKAPENAITRKKEAPIDLLKRIKQANIEWVRPGHRDGQNFHNISATVSVKDDEWGVVGDFVWKNRDYFSALTFLPYFESNYKQMPFEDIDEFTFRRLTNELHAIDLSNIKEIDPEINHSRDSVACAGGVCELV